MTDSPPPAGGDDDVSLAQQPVLALSAASRAVAATRAGSTNWQWTVLRAAEVPRPSGRSYEDPPIEQPLAPLHRTGAFIRIRPHPSGKRARSSKDY